MNIPSVLLGRRPSSAILPMLLRKRHFRLAEFLKQQQEVIPGMLLTWIET